MNATLVPLHSVNIPHRAMTIPAKADTAQATRQSANHLENIPTVIEGHGVAWHGRAENLSRLAADLIVEGSPLVSPSQAIHLQFQSEHDSVEMMGTVQGIVPLGERAETRWSRVRITVVYEWLDDLKWHRIKRSMKTANTYSLSSYVRGTLISPDPGDNLWKLKPRKNGNDANTSTSGTETLHRQNSDTRRSAQRSLLNRQKVTTPGPDALHDPAASPVPIVSTHFELSNKHGQRIRAYHDVQDAPVPADSPVMVIMPGYGETKREYITLAYYLASNGFHVVRYDHTNHVGESDGEHINTTLSMMREDLSAVLDYVETHWPNRSKGLVAPSLAGRVATKSVAHEAQVDFLVLLTPIVDVRSTLNAVHQEDLIGDYEHGKAKGLTNVLGFNVELDHWLADAVQNQYASLETAYEDASRIDAPVVVISAEHDAWVEMGSTQTIVDTVGTRLQEWLVIPQGLHRILESPKQARAVYREVVRFARNTLWPSRQPLPVQEPTRKAIGRQNKFERDQKRSRDIPVELSEFWKDYLQHFHYIVNFSDYQQLLDHISKLLGPIGTGEKVLDAGCGNGNLGAFFRRMGRRPSYDGRAGHGSHFHYVGIDFVLNALRHAKGSIQATLMSQGAVEEDRGHFDIGNSHSYHCADLNKALPFKDGTFDKIVSNLVLGYLENPARTLGELMRVLKPGGTLVLTNLKPNSDLSRIFTNFVHETSKTEEIEEAKQLLNNSGKIREAEGEGIFHFPDAEELNEMVRLASPGTETKIFQTFANQAFIVVANKAAALEEPVDQMPWFARQAA